MRSHYAASIAILSATIAHAQECGTGRYIQSNYFSAVTVTNAVPFGSNTGVNGNAQTLYMDVYQPTGDSLQARPAVIVAFGGSFVAGTRADVADICTDFAKRGYVAIAPDYRVGFFLPNSTTTMRAVIRGAHDLKAAARYLRRSVAELGNPYHIDPDRIITGGVSAGAISAIHAQYLDQDSEVPAAMAAEVAGIGGIEGNSGSPGYDSHAFAVYSFSGCIGDTTWMVQGDTPICSLHEVGDQVVPYYTQQVYVGGIPTGLTASGSHDLHLRANNAGMVNCFKSYPGTGHIGYLTTDYANAMNWTAHFLGQLVCDEATVCDASAIDDRQEGSNSVLYPNPTTDVVRLTIDQPATVQVFDAEGRMVIAQRCATGLATIDLSSLRAGIYQLRSAGACRRIVKQ